LPFTHIAPTCRLLRTLPLHSSRGLLTLHARYTRSRLRLRGYTHHVWFTYLRFDSTAPFFCRGCVLVLDAYRHLPPHLVPHRTPHRAHCRTPFAWTPHTYITAHVTYGLPRACGLRTTVAQTPRRCLRTHTIWFCAPAALRAYLCHRTATLVLVRAPVRSARHRLPRFAAAATLPGFAVLPTVLPPAVGYAFAVRVLLHGCRAAVCLPAHSAAPPARFLPATTCTHLPPHYPTVHVLATGTAQPTCAHLCTQLRLHHTTTTTVATALPRWFCADHRTGTIFCTFATPARLRTLLPLRTHGLPDHHRTYLTPPGAPPPATALPATPSPRDPGSHRRALRCDTCIISTHCPFSPGSRIRCFLVHHFRTCPPRYAPAHTTAICCTPPCHHRAATRLRTRDTHAHTVALLFHACTHLHTTRTQVGFTATAFMRLVRCTVPVGDVRLDSSSLRTVPFLYHLCTAVCCLDCWFFTTAFSLVLLQFTGYTVCPGLLPARLHYHTGHALPFFWFTGSLHTTYTRTCATTIYTDIYAHTTHCALHAHLSARGLPTVPGATPAATRTYAALHVYTPALPTHTYGLLPPPRVRCLPLRLPPVGFYHGWVLPGFCSPARIWVTAFCRCAWFHRIPPLPARFVGWFAAAPPGHTLPPAVSGFCRFYAPHHRFYYIPRFWRVATGSLLRADTHACRAAYPFARIAPATTHYAHYPHGCATPYHGPHDYPPTRHCTGTLRCIRTLVYRTPVRTFRAAAWVRRRRCVCGSTHLPAACTHRLHTACDPGLPAVCCLYTTYCLPTCRFCITLRCMPTTPGSTIPHVLPVGTFALPHLPTGFCHTRLPTVPAHHFTPRLHGLHRVAALPALRTCLHVPFPGSTVPLPAFYLVHLPHAAHTPHGFRHAGATHHHTHCLPTFYLSAGYWIHGASLPRVTAYHLPSTACARTPHLPVLRPATALPCRYAARSAFTGHRATPPFWFGCMRFCCCARARHAAFAALRWTWVTTAARRIHAVLLLRVLLPFATRVPTWNTALLYAQHCLV